MTVLRRAQGLTAEAMRRINCRHPRMRDIQQGLALAYIH